LSSRIADTVVPNVEAMPTRVSPFFTLYVRPLGDTLGPAAPDEPGDWDAEGDWLGRGVGLGVTLGLGVTDGDSDEIGAAAGSGDERRATASAAKAMTMRTTSATCETARSSGQRALGADSRECSRTTVAVRAIGRREASATATTDASRPGASIEARLARAAR